MLELDHIGQDAGLLQQLGVAPGGRVLRRPHDASD
jgi:hypothetical protein